MILDYTGYQLSAMTALAVYASASDGHIDEREMAIIFNHLAAFSPDEALRSALVEEAARLTISYDDAIAVVRNMSITQKRHFCAFIAMVILADRKITNSELEFWNVLVYETNLPVKTLKEAGTILADEIGVKIPNHYPSSGNSGCCLVIAIPLILVMLITMSVNYLA